MVGHRRIATVGLILVSTIAACSKAPVLPPILVTGSDAELEVMTNTGAGVPLLPEGSDVTATQAAWAPGGALAIWTETTSGGEARIAMGSDTSQRRIDGGTSPYFYAWSPDATRVAYLGNAPDGSGVALGMVDVASGTAELIDSGQPYYLDWSADSSRLAIHANRTDLFYVDLDGTRTDIDAVPGLFQAPAVLPDGRLLILTGGPEPGLVALAEDGGETVLSRIGGVSFFAASPDGSRVAFTDNSSGDLLGPLRMVSTSGGEPTYVTPESVAAFQWAPTGTALMFLGLDDARSGLIPSVWDGTDVMIYEPIVPSSTFLASYLPFWDQYSRVLSIWSPDGASFLLPVDGGNILIYTIDEPTPRRLTEGEFASWSGGER